MNDEMTEKQKSYLIAKALGWRVASLPHKSVFIRKVVDANGNDVGLDALGGGIAPREQELVPHRLINLYDTSKMATAWLALSWATNLAYDNGEDDTLEEILGSIDGMVGPAEAQRAWLDEILEWATETGMVEEAAPAP